ncbi:MAG: nucleoside triphosphate pyrophosphohydrolase [Candidatus Daviesbacteria bacterium]
MVKYNKLVRDKIPEIIQADGKILTAHVASDQEYWQKLMEKLKEETAEFATEDSNIPDELADILEVVYAICDFKGIKPRELENIRKAKAHKRGGFKDKIILEQVAE